MAQGRTDRSSQQSGLTKETMVQAALRVLEREGLEGLSMRKLATELGVQAASLYWHVSNKEELLDLLVDALVADAVPPPREGDWREQVREYYVRYRRHLLSKRDAAKVIAGRLATGPNQLRFLEDFLDRLRLAGFRDSDAALAAYTLSTYVQGFVLQELSPLSASEATAKGTRRDVALAEGNRLRALSPERFPNVTALAEHLTQPNMEDRFRFGLERIIDGLEALLPSANETGSGGPTA